MSPLSRNIRNANSNPAPLILKRRIRIHQYVQWHTTMWLIKLQNNSQITLPLEGYICLLNNFTKYLLTLFSYSIQIFFKCQPRDLPSSFNSIPLCSDFLNSYLQMWSQDSPYAQSFIWNSNLWHADLLLTHTSASLTVISLLTFFPPSRESEMLPLLWSHRPLYLSFPYVFACCHYLSSIPKVDYESHRLVKK